MSPAARPALAAAMSRQAGVFRDRAGLESLLRLLEQAPPADRGLDLAVLEATSLHTVCTLVVTAALARTESRGCHRWRDIPAVTAGPARHTVLRARDTVLHSPEHRARPDRPRPEEERMTLDTLVSDALQAAGLDPVDTEQIVRGALDEDFRYGPDATSAATAPAGQQAVAEVVARQPGVLAGLPVALAVLDAAGLAPSAATPLRADGDRVGPGIAVLRIRGPLREMLGAERTLLNFLTHLSGIATATRAWVDVLAGTGAVLRDTRKTTPGLRQLEKYAVRCGGGVNHRMGLGDAALVKDNHVARGGRHHGGDPGRPGGRARPAARSRVRQRGPGRGGAGRRGRADPAGQHEPGRPARRGSGGDGYPAARLEASGGLRLGQASAVAATGVHYLSVGALTHSAPALDLGLDLRPAAPNGQ